MATVFVFLPEGFEETEAIVTVDILRRGGVTVRTVSLTDEYMIKGSHGIQVKADTLFWHVAENIDANALVLPGGPGASTYKAHQGLVALIKRYEAHEKILAAICAAPATLGELGLLNGKNAVCYPGFEEALIGANFEDQPVVQDGRILTAKGPGAAMAFAFALLQMLTGADNTHQVADGFIAPPSLV